MAIYKARPLPDIEAFCFGSLEEKPEWLKAAYACGLVSEHGHTMREGPFLRVAPPAWADAREPTTASVGDYLVWDGEARILSVCPKASFVRRYVVETSK